MCEFLLMHMRGCVNVYNREGMLMSMNVTVY